MPVSEIQWHEALKYRERPDRASPPASASDPHLPNLLRRQIPPGDSNFEEYPPDSRARAFRRQL